ncbi:MAG: asparagine--tRNA ligase [Methanobacteriota archaeon]|nr:MAG: asparagine--tRNA ligase [Euryarchaeota archaeon]
MPKIAEMLSEQYEGKDVEIAGWIYRTRSSGSLVFVVLRDSSGIVQVTVNRDEIPEEDFLAAEKALVESSVVASGTVATDDRAPGGFEIRAKSFRVIGFADKYPITKDQSTEFLLDKRHLWIRSRKMTNVMKVRSTVFGAIHDFFRNNEYYEVQAPILTPAMVEGGSTLFKVDYYEKELYLAQSWQLYAEAMVMALEKIYCIAPSFRAEKFRTTRHLTEYWHAEMEIAWAGMDECIDEGEKLISHICQQAVEKNGAELDALGRVLESLESIVPPFPRMKYEEAVEMLQKKGMDIEWGKDLRTLEERELMGEFDRPLIVTHYPKEIMAFYKPRDPEDPKSALCFDFHPPETGDEIIGGSERDADIEELKRSLEREGEDVSNYEWYLDTRRYGSVQHSGFGMGIERVVQWICGLQHIRDAVPFPRTVARYYP